MSLGGLSTASIAAPAPSAATAGRPDPNWLHLTPDQQKKMQVRQKQMSDDWQKLVGDKKMTDAQKQAKAQQLQAAYQADMLAMLTPAQKVLVDKQKQVMIKRKAAADARMKQIMTVEAHLMKSLSPTQQKAVDKIRDDDMKTAKSVEDDKSLSENAKQARLGDLTRDENKKINAVLNPAQRADFQKLQDLIPAPRPQ